MFRTGCRKPLILRSLKRMSDDDRNNPSRLKRYGSKNEINFRSIIKFVQRELPFIPLVVGLTSLWRLRMGIYPGFREQDPDRL